MAETDFTEFLAKWHHMVEQRDLARIDDFLTEETELCSPAFWTPKKGRAYVGTVLRAVVSGVENFRYTGEWAGDGRLVLEFQGEVGGVALKGIDIISLDAEGRIARIEVLVRPMNGLAAIAEMVKGAFARPMV
jgi:hypothetical protein